MASPIAILRQIAADVRDGLRLGGLGGVYAQVVGKRAYRLDSPLIGRLVELAGDRARLDGCRFHLRGLTTAVKSRFVFGVYEFGERQGVKTHLDPALPLIELGASIGVLSCIANRRLRDPQRQVVVEANPELLPYLEANRALNGCVFTIVNQALAYDGDTVTFHLHDNFLGGSVERQTGRAVTVPATTLEAVAREAGFERFNLLCDIEGMETDLVAREIDFLARAVAVLIVEQHDFMVGRPAIDAMFAALTAAGFRQAAQITNSVSVWKQTAHSDPA